MRNPAYPRVAEGVALLALIALLALCTWPAAGGASERLHAPAEASASADQEVARIAAYWTPERMRNTPPLLAPGTRRPDPLAVASFAPVPDATVPPYVVEGRIFVRQGKSKGYCSGTAINSPTRRLVLTAGHCVNTGPRGLRGTSAWSRYLEFVPAYTDGTAPFGTFVARRPEVYAPDDWVRFGNPNYDIGAFLTTPTTPEGLNVADAVGGGVTIGLDLTRKQNFQTFGYPGKTRRMQQCESPAVGDDPFTYQAPGPPTVRIRCHWLPGASGGGWLTEGGTIVNGLTSYGRNRDLTHTYGPYFSKRTVGKVVAGL